MSSIFKSLKQALILLMLMTLICGVIYPALVTLVAQLGFPYQSNGSMMVLKDASGSERIYGSELLGQSFSKPEYLIGRPAGTSNLSPVCAEQKSLVEERIRAWKALDPDNQALIPMDLVTASASGLDPHISPEAAEYQVERIAKLRGISSESVRHIIAKYSSPRFGLFMGEAVVNVLKVNLALDGLI